MPKIVSRVSPFSVVVWSVLIAGCGSSDERLVELSERSLARQAEQNQQFAQQNKEVTTATKALVAADSQTRRELVRAHAELQRGIQIERSKLDRQHESLERERKILPPSDNETRS